MAVHRFRVECEDDKGQRFTVTLPGETEADVYRSARDHEVVVLGIERIDDVPDDAKIDERIASAMIYVGLFIAPVLIMAIFYGVRARAKSDGKIGTLAVAVASVLLGLWVLVVLAMFPRVTM